MNETSIITRYRRKNLCAITSGSISSIPKITHIAFGDGGVDADGEPTPPLDTDTQLVNEIERYSIDSVTYPTQGKDGDGNDYDIDRTTARYSVTIPANELPGERISEAALVDEAGQLCAIKHMYVKQKDPDVSFTFEFDDKF